MCACRDFVACFAAGCSEGRGATAGAGAGAAGEGGAIAGALNVAESVSSRVDNVACWFSIICSMRCCCAVVSRVRRIRSIVCVMPIATVTSSAPTTIDSIHFIRRE